MVNNPKNEHSRVFTLKTLFLTPKPVIDSISACENIEINGGDDVNDDGPVEPHPTRCEVLKAVSTIT